MERETALPRGDYMPQLDGLRALAVGCVLIAHFVVPLARFPFGSVGVLLFFVLSGYLITGILLRARDDAEREGTSRLFALRQFYVRRFLRIFPLYYLVLTLAALANAGEARKMVWWNAAYLSNFYMAAHGWQHPISHFWTLAVEEQFYIAWPWVVMFLPWRLVAPVVSAAIAVPLLWKLAVTHATGNLFAAGILTPSCLDTLGAGSLLAIAARAGRPRPPSWMLWLGLPLVAAGVVLFHRNQEQIAWSILMGYGMALTGVWLVGRGALGFEGPVSAGSFRCRRWFTSAASATASTSGTTSCRGLWGIGARGCTLQGRARLRRGFLEPCCCRRPLRFSSRSPSTTSSDFSRIRVHGEMQLAGPKHPLRCVHSCAVG
ncbi:MAG: hypothetical protein JWN24_4783 [Phycisphaerales bacterium]|nr:hypothetical protein [Phycisphaerales bacterium]